MGLQLGFKFMACRLRNQADIDGYKRNPSKLRDVFTHQTKPLYPGMSQLS